MDNKYIPTILKNKISKLSRLIYATFLLLVFIFLMLSMVSFNVNDNSFLTNTNNTSTNLLGNFGSYLSSFIFYTLGVMGYFLVIFFLIYSLSVYFDKNPRYLFIRLLLFIVGLLLIPQSLIFWEIEIPFHPEIELWGFYSNKIFILSSVNYLSYILTSIGLVLFLFSLNIIHHLKFSDTNFKSIFSTNKPVQNNQIKKEPIIFSDTKNISSYENTQVFDKPSNKSEIKNNGQYKSPSLNILDSKEENFKQRNNKKNIDDSSDLLERVFADFNISIKVINVKLGPVITLYEILPSAGTKINTIINLAGDISRSMGVGAVRIAQIYGTQFLGVEVPNDNREPVTIKELLSNENFKNSLHKIPICIGKDIAGNIEVIDLSKTPHLLVAGTTGSGKSVFINTLLTSLLYKFPPSELRLILIDPKMLELSVYNDIAHLLTPVVTEPKKSIIALKWVCKEMERRYSLMNEENTRSLEGYNQKSIEKLPYIVVFIDEMADLMMTAGKEVEHYVQRLAQMARACGIHLVMATQRPSVDIITGSIKANFPSRISFQVASKYDSRTVLGEIGAEQLLGNGDMLMSKNGSNLIRYQSAFISDEEVNKLIKEIKQTQKVEYLEELEEIINSNDENFDSLSDDDEELITKSIDLIKSTNKASTSFLQRNFQIGYNKAARIMEALEQRGVVSAPNHTGKRQILIN